MLFFILPILVWVTSCKDASFELIIEYQKSLKDIPSASGILHLKDYSLIIGDNSPFLFKLDSKFQIDRKITIFPWSSDSLIPKGIKPDFEALTLVSNNNKTEIFVFGSGSKSPSRDLLVRLYGDSIFVIQRYSLGKFYKHLKSKKSFKNIELNIEAAAATQDKLFLFNREGNLVLEFELSDFLKMLENPYLKMPSPKFYKIKLPKLQNVQASFSGATVIAENNTIIFTASVENNSNPIADGEILGSFIGIIPIEKLKDGFIPYCKVIDKKSGTDNLKIESVDVVNDLNVNKIEVFLVSDSDGGTSEIIKAHLLLN